MTREARTALVTGANRGMGLETCRQLALRSYTVVLASRDDNKGAVAARTLAAGGAAVIHRTLDVADPRSIHTLQRALDAEFGGIDVLVNNAAVYPDEGRSVLDVAPTVFRDTMTTNFLGPLALCQAFVPGMMRRCFGRVVNVSSGLGQLSTMRNYAPSYAASKAALNALTRMVADAAQGRGVLVNAVDPGWVRTDMGGVNATRSVAQGVDTIVWLATLPDDGPTGGFFYDRRAVAW